MYTVPFAAAPGNRPFIREASPVIRLARDRSANDPRFNVRLFSAYRTPDVFQFPHTRMKKIRSLSARAFIPLVTQPGAFAQTHRTVRRVT